MTEKQMRYISLTAVSIGMMLQAIGYGDAVIEMKPNWATCWLISMPLLLFGYYAGMRGKGYRPYTIPSFYGMALLVIVPFVGSMAVARKLFFTPRQGAVSDKKRWQFSLWAIAMFIAMALALSLLSLPGFIAEHRKAKGVEHVGPKAHHADREQGGMHGMFFVCCKGVPMSEGR